jgi:predicted CopG family antitoxin
MAYPEGYRAVHLRADIYERLQNLKDFENLSNQEKINQLIRFYNVRK